MRYEEALLIAERTVDRWRPFCTRIEIAGSIRRGSPEVKDIEIVAAPVMTTNLFGDADPTTPNALDARIDAELKDRIIARRLRDDGHIQAFGPKFKALVTEGARLDLFVTLPPAQWGAVFAIRTGPWEFSQYLVTACRGMGLRCEGGALRRKDGSLFETPEEEDFFGGCGVPWVAPSQRK